MRKSRKSLVSCLTLVSLMLLLASCAAPAVENEPSVMPTAEVTISLPPNPTPTPIPEQREFVVGEVIWGPSEEDINTQAVGDPTFHEEPLTDQSRVEEFADWIYETCHNCPTALAAAAYAFPSIQAGCYLNTTDPAEITDILYTSTKNGEIQQQLLRNLSILLETADLEAVNVSGMVRMGQGYVIKPNGPYFTILGFSWTQPFQVNNAIQLKVTRTFADGGEEIGYFTNDYHCSLSVPVNEAIVG